MQLHRVVLLVPFVRHYAGSVFELYLNPTPEGWDEDVRVREKISFNRHAYLLPDNGKGAPANLSQSDTIPCPPGLFEGVDLRTGPCRITAIQPLSAIPPGGVPGAELADVGGNSGQGILLRMNAEAKALFKVQLTDMRENNIIETYELAQNPLLLDCSRLQPGFYRATVEGRNGYGIALHFIKCFPLVALLRNGSRDITGSMKTVY
jgi:hypothetical protein